MREKESRKGLNCSKQGIYSDLQITSHCLVSHLLVKEGFREKAKHFAMGTVGSGTSLAFEFGEEASRLDIHRLHLQTLCIACVF